MNWLWWTAFTVAMLAFCATLVALQVWHRRREQAEYEEFIEQCRRDTEAKRRDR